MASSFSEGEFFQLSQQWTLPGYILQKIGDSNNAIYYICKMIFTPPLDSKKAPHPPSAPELWPPVTSGSATCTAMRHPNHADWEL